MQTVQVLLILLATSARPSMSLDVPTSYDSCLCWVRPRNKAFTFTPIAVAAPLQRHALADLQATQRCWIQLYQPFCVRPSTAEPAFAWWQHPVSGFQHLFTLKNLSAIYTSPSFRLFLKSFGNLNQFWLTVGPWDLFKTVLRLSSLCLRTSQRYIFHLSACLCCRIRKASKYTPLFFV